MKSKKGPLRVLMVEDEPLLGRLGIRALEELGGMEAILAEDGERGLELAETWQPDVILLDLVLPVMSGVELLRQYRRQGGRAKVLVITGADSERAKEIVFGLGADFLMCKPVRWDEVFSLIRLLAGGLEEECRGLLRDMGAREGSKGFEQAAECAALLGDGSCELLKEAYIEVAKRQGTSSGCVSKNIERLAGELHKTGTPLYYKLTGRDRSDPALTNREFLDLLSQAARIPL